MIKKSGLPLLLALGISMLIPVSGYAASILFCDDPDNRSVSFDTSGTDFDGGVEGDFNSSWTTGCKEGFAAAKATPPKDVAICGVNALNPAWTLGCQDGYAAAKTAAPATPAAPATQTATPTSQPAATRGNTIQLQNPLGSTSDIPTLLNTIFGEALKIISFIVPIIIIYAAFQMMFAAGNPEKFAAGRNTILYTVIGYAILLAARGIMAIIKELLTV